MWHIYIKQQPTYVVCDVPTVINGAAKRHGGGWRGGDAAAGGNKGGMAMAGGILVLLC